MASARVREVEMPPIEWPATPTRVQSTFANDLWRLGLALHVVITALCWCDHNGSVPAELITEATTTIP